MHKRYCFGFYVLGISVVSIQMFLKIIFVNWLWIKNTVPVFRWIDEWLRKMIHWYISRSNLHIDNERNRNCMCIFQNCFVSSDVLIIRPTESILSVWAGNKVLHLCSIALNMHNIFGYKALNMTILSNRKRNFYKICCLWFQTILSMQWIRAIDSIWSKNVHMKIIRYRIRARTWR